MASTIPLSHLPDNARVRILNPAAGGERFTSAKRARRFVQAKRAHMDAAGHLVFHGLSQSVGQARLDTLLVSSYSGCDAFPDRAVFPPSGEVLARLSSPRGPVRPPVQER